MTNIKRNTHEDLHRWGSSLDREHPRGLGETLLCYAEDWRTEIDDLRKERDATLEDSRLRDALQNLVEAVEIAPGKRAAYYNLDYMEHDVNCENRGDQSCDCGVTQSWCNIDQLLDECEGYNGTAAIDKARAALAAQAKGG